MIKNETEYQLALQSIEPLLKKGFDSLSVDETTELASMTDLIEAYESEHYRLPFKPKTLIEMLELKMFERKIKQKGLATLLGVTENRISEVMNGKRKVNIELAKRLHDKLGIDAGFLLRNA